MSEFEPSPPVPRRSRLREVLAGLVIVTVIVSVLAVLIGLRQSGQSQDAVGGAASAAAGGGDGGSADNDVLGAGGDGLAAGDVASAGQRAPETRESLLVERAVIRTGAMSLVNDEVEAARRDVLGVTEALGGFVADEQTRADRDGGLRSVDVTLKVPTDDLDTAMERIGQAGTVVARSQSARDVTEQVVDVDSRVDSAEAALRRVRLLLKRATSLGNVIRLEQVLSRRQADLESLLAQQESLAARTTMATLRVDVSTPAAAPEEPQPAGFLAGLVRGWEALGTGYVVLATVAGTVLPFLLVLGALALLAKYAAGRSRSLRGVVRRRHMG